ncbi:zinc finger protein 567-like [Xyrichtys novacula]|uniref:Zinc finger protein 567-like n=1 Tax=Xyrichtys novacula TaxID=13765 RepID=A0AAV1EIB6_XYRNO|nr:zinc finger protein 567-like [Xyrichtys novacula]
MYYWMRRSSGGSETLDGPGNMSKAEILRGIITEKLCTAAQEILAVVERTVSGYEEEAAGLRQEIDRQRSQLEAVLQPRVSLEKQALIQDEEEDHEVVVLSDGVEEEPTQQTGYEDTGSLGMWYHEDEDDIEDEEQQIPAHLTTPRSGRRRDDLKDPDFQITPRVHSGRRRPGRPRLIDSQNHVDLKIRILESSQIDILSNNVFPKYPVQDLRCPRGLQEADFLDLLRSTFPQLAGQTDVEFFTSDRSKRLLPLSAESLTPEEIYRSIRQSGTGKSTLYIRLKTAGDLQDVDFLQRPGMSMSMSADRTFSGAPSEKRKRGRPRLGEEPTHHRLRVCLLDGASQSDVFSKKDLLNSPIRDLRCPRGLQEADFLALLRSSFPQLSNQKPFHVFKSDRSRRLQRIRAKALTPEEIYRSMRSTGVEKSLLYIRLQTEEEEAELQRNEPTVTASPSAAAAVETEPDAAGLGSSSSPLPPPQEAEGADGEAAETQVDSSEDDEVKGQDEDWNPDNRESTSTPRVSPVRVVAGRRNPCKVCGVWYNVQSSLIKHAWTHVDEAASVCGLCGQQFESVDQLKDHLRTYQKTYNCSYCGKSFLTVAGLQRHTTLHTGERPYKCDVCSKTFAQTHALRLHRWVHAADKPHKCDICQKAFGLKATLRAHRMTHTRKDGYQCNICGKTLRDVRSLARHKTTHSGERRYGCGVCGKRFKLAYTLKAHEKTHTRRERLFLCHICCKSFFSNCGLMAHMRTHNNVRPFPCVVCGRGFVSKGELKVHLRVHTGEAPYGCSQCGRHFKRKTHLNNHVRSHLGLKLFVCSVCGKACSRQEHLTVHMRTHNGERPYQCGVCDKAFTQGHCLKTHMKSHHGQDDALLNAPSN